MNTTDKNYVDRLHNQQVNELNEIKKTKNTHIPNNYSLFGVNYSDNCRTTRQLLAFLYELLGFRSNYSVFISYQRCLFDWILPSDANSLRILPAI